MARYRALRDLALRKRPDPKCDEWYEWKQGEVFTPPDHMKVDLALASGKIEEVKESGETKRARR